MDWWQNRLGWPAICLLFFCGCSNLFSQSKPKPIWTTDLLQNPLYAARVKLVQEPSSRKWINPQLAFIGSNTLAISFDDDEQPLMTNLNQLRHFHFRAIFVNAEDGKFKNRDLSWATIDGDSKLLPMHDGGFVVVAGQHLYRYSPDFEPVKDILVPTETASDGSSEFGYEPPTRYVWQEEHWHAKEDPLQETIILEHLIDKSVSYFWFDGDTLKLTASTNLPTSGKWSYAKWRSAFSASNNTLIEGYGEDVLIDRLGDDWQPFCTNYKNAAATLVGNNIFFLAYSGKEGIQFALLGGACDDLLDLPGTASGVVAAESAQGNRIAISESFIENILSGVVFTNKVRVWNLAPPREISNFTFTPELKTESVVHNLAFAAALSPDGKQLAVLLDSHLMLFTLEE